MQRIVFAVVLMVASALCAEEPIRIYRDVPFLQDYAEKIPLTSELSDAKLMKVRADRNGRILVLSNKGLLQVHAGELVPDRLHRPVADMRIIDMEVRHGQFVYLTDKLVLSNQWVGRLLAEHGVRSPELLEMGNDLDAVVLSPGRAKFLRGGETSQSCEMSDASIKQAVFDSKRDRFLIFTDSGLSCLEPGGQAKVVAERKGLSCFGFAPDADSLLVGTSNGYITLDAASFEQYGDAVENLPWPDIRCIKAIGSRVWYGTPRGAFVLSPGARTDYYASKRWLVDDAVIDIAPGPDDSVLVLTEKGLSIIHFEKMTLAGKAEHFDRLTRKRHIRYGFNSAFVMSEPGNLSTGALVDQDNDGLWTAMYLAGELFRYSVTKSPDALRNCYESFEAMERLTTITPMEGFPARSFERTGYQLADKQHWHKSPDGQWMWKGTTSSDEIVGHFFVYTIFAEIAPDESWRKRAIALMDSIMDHIVRNDLYLVDYDGKPTLWGKWNPEYVNKFPRQVGDRRLNSAEIISFLQAAYHFTGKEKYKQKAYELIEQHGYLDNIMIPMTEIGRVPGIHLTTEWNHSDDELAFLSYWNLYRYAFTDELREKFRKAIRGHWQAERPEKNPLWDFIYASTGAGDFDLEESIWWFREFPLDTISWAVINSHRKDLEGMEPNFREQTTKTVLPPDERPMGKHNVNGFRLDGGNGGRREYSGDIYTLPYWMGRHLGIIK